MAYKKDDGKIKIEVPSNEDNALPYNWYIHEIDSSGKCRLEKLYKDILDQNKAEDADNEY